MNETDLKKELERLKLDNSNSEELIDFLEKEINTYNNNVESLKPKFKQSKLIYNKHKAMIDSVGKQIAEYYNALDEETKRKNNIPSIDFDEYLQHGSKKITVVGNDAGVRYLINSYNNLVEKLPSAYTEYDLISKEINNFNNLIQRCKKEIFKTKELTKKGRISFLTNKIKESEEEGDSNNIITKMRALITSGIREMPRSASSNFVPTTDEINKGSVLVEQLVNEFTKGIREDEMVDIDALFIEGEEEPEYESINIVDGDEEDEYEGADVVGVDLSSNNLERKVHEEGSSIQGEDSK